MMHNGSGYELGKESDKEAVVKEIDVGEGVFVRM